MIPNAAADSIGQMMVRLEARESMEKANVAVLTFMRQHSGIAGVILSDFEIAATGVLAFGIKAQDRATIRSSVRNWCDYLTGIFKPTQ